MTFPNPLLPESPDGPSRPGFLMQGATVVDFDDLQGHDPKAEDEKASDKSESKTESKPESKPEPPSKPSDKK